MQARSLMLALIAALLLTVGAIAAACGGEDSLTLEEYFQQLDAVIEDTDRQANALEDIEEMDLASEEEQLEAMRAFFDGFLPIIEGTFDEIESLDPPAEVEDTHNALLAAGDDLVAGFQEIASRLAAAESLVDLLELFDDPEFEAVAERFEQACFAVQDIAVDNGITVDLNCEDED